MIITAKIDVKKIDKTKLFAGKTGALYLDIVLMENRDGTDKYGNDFMIVQSSSKEDRAAGRRGAILGNGKVNGRTSAPKQQKDHGTYFPPAQDGDDGSVPF